MASLLSPANLGERGRRDNRDLFPLSDAVLAEDVRYIQLNAAELSMRGPRLSAWLANIFGVLGGHGLATGVLTIALAATVFRDPQPLATWPPG